MRRPSGEMSERSAKMRPRNHGPGLKLSFARFQITMRTSLVGPRRRTTPTGASDASRTVRRGLGPDVDFTFPFSFIPRGGDQEMGADLDDLATRSVFPRHEVQFVI